MRPWWSPLRSKAWFEATFDAAPSVRGALHAGTVVAGEVGVHRRSIVFHGDVMNVCARLEQAARDMNCPFLASHAAIRLLEDAKDYVIVDRGVKAFRGRQASMSVFDVSRQHERPINFSAPAGSPKR